MTARILVVDDDRSMTDLIQAGLSKQGYEVSQANSGNEALELLEDLDADAVVTDINMQGMSGLELCDRLAAGRPDLPVIVITAFGSMETAIGAIRAGAYDFICKPFDLVSLRLTLERAVKHRRLHAEVRRLRQMVSDGTDYGPIVGESRAIRRTIELIARVGPTEATVLITGPSGTGKELVAEALHKRSARREGPFVPVNCAAVPEPLLESELFGHTRGAFTDARTDRSGLFLKASGGTLFLDEIGEIPLTLQPKLLRALQERTVKPVGKDTETPFDTRILAATNRDLEAAVERGEFRRDLYYRINVVQIDVPPLRLRGNDVLLLAQHFIDRCNARYGRHVKGLSASAGERLLSYDWPGNVRELQNAIERAVALTRFDEIAVEDLPVKIRGFRGYAASADPDSGDELLPMDEVERRYILKVLQAVSGNKKRAAEILGFDRKTLYRKLERFGLGE